MSDEVHCPTCGAPAERGQLVCLECGGRVALTYRRPPSWKIPVAISTLVVLVFLAVVVVAVASAREGARDEVAAAPPHPQRAGPASDAPSKARRAASPALVRRGLLWSWPRDLTGYTTVVQTTQDADSARSFAVSVAAGKAGKVGVLRGDDFASLPPGNYMVFAGRSPDRARADAVTARLGRRYDGAFTQRVGR